MNNIHKFKLSLDSDNIYTDEFKELMKQCIEQYSSSKQNMRGLVTLLLRYYIKMNDINMIKDIIHNNNNDIELMRRDFLAALDYFLKLNDYNSTLGEIEYIYNNITDIETKDVDLMIENKWIDLLKKFDGLMVECSLKSNVTDTSKLKKYKYDISIMKNKYTNRILNKEELDIQLQNVDVLIDGANIGHLKKEFDFSILPIIIHKLIKLKFNPKIILHERHNIEDEFLKPYLIRTPMYRNDDDYMIYGMLQFNTMVLTNDLFRDHLKNMDINTKCFVRSMSMKYNNNTKGIIIIPKYSKCIQVIENDGIYIPCKNNFYKINLI
jgi:hypothetical protein